MMLMPAIAIPVKHLKMTNTMYEREKELLIPNIMVAR